MKKLTTTASPNIQAKFVICSEATIQAAWVKILCQGYTFLGFSSSPIKIYCDNSSVWLLFHEEEEV